VQVTGPAEAAGLIDRLRASGVTLIYDPDTRTFRTGDSNGIAVTNKGDTSRVRAPGYSAECSLFRPPPGLLTAR
jgi:hypothetical protein